MYFQFGRSVRFPPPAPFISRDLPRFESLRVSAAYLLPILTSKERARTLSEIWHGSRHFLRATGDSQPNSLVEKSVPACGRKCFGRKRFGTTAARWAL